MNVNEEYYLMNIVDENSSGSTENEINGRLLNDSNLPAEWDEIAFGSREREIDRMVFEDLTELVEQNEMRSGSAEREIDRMVLEDLGLAERAEIGVRDGAKAENTDDVDEMAEDLSDRFAPLTLIGTDEKTQE